MERLHASGSETARLDTELLLGDAVGVGRTVILAHPDAPVGADASAVFRAGIQRRAAGEPVAYIRGFKEFFGLTMLVDSRALIPRPETERLVELAEAEVVRRLGSGEQGAGVRPLRIADVGTGSGAIAVTLAVTLRRRGALQAVEISATDISRAALDLARENALRHAVTDGIVFEQADLLIDRGEGRGGEALGRPPFDLILANLPYVRHGAMAGLPRATSFEPALALDGGADGLVVIDRLLQRLPVALTDDGLALLEIGADQGEAIVTSVAATLPGWRCIVEPDLAGLPRVARVSRS